MIPVVGFLVINLWCDSANPVRAIFISAVQSGAALSFSYETGFEVYDSYGLVVKKGFGKEVRIDNLEKGKYYLCYDNQITEFNKKK